MPFTFGKFGKFGKNELDAEKQRRNELEATGRYPSQRPIALRRGTETLALCHGVRRARNRCTDSDNGTFNVLPMPLLFHSPNVQGSVQEIWVPRIACGDSRNRNLDCSPLP